jgi:DNA-binding response OmpR family regulator
VRRVLVVEPDSDVLETLGQVLLQEDFQVLLITSVSEATEKIPSFAPDVLLFDASLNLAGLVAMTQLARNYGARLVAMTTQTTKSRQDFGASAVLFKPFAMEELGSALK